MQQSITPENATNRNESNVSVIDYFLAPLQQCNSDTCINPPTFIKITHSNDNISPASSSISTSSVSNRIGEQSFSDISGISNIFANHSQALLLAYDSRASDLHRLTRYTDRQAGETQYRNRFFKPMNMDTESRLKNWEQNAQAMSEIYEQLESQLNTINETFFKLETNSRLNMERFDDKNNEKCPYKTLLNQNDIQGLSMPDVFVVFQKKTQ